MASATHGSFGEAQCLAVGLQTASCQVSAAEVAAGTDFSSLLLRCFRHHSKLFLKAA